MNKNKLNALVLCMIVLLSGALSFAILFGGSPRPVYAATSPALSNIVYIIMENRNYGDVIGSSSAPYENTLASQYAYASGGYRNLGSPSLPNYIALTAGQEFSCLGDDTDSPNSDTCTKAVWTSQNLVDLLEAKGISWKAYMECLNGGSGCGGTHYYVPHHDPFIYYSDIVNNPARASKHVDAGSADSVLLSDLNSASAPQLMWLSPDNCNNTHDCGVSSGDTWLAGLVPQILASNTFKTKNAALMIGWDEYGSPPGPIFAGPGVKLAFKSSASYDHYSLLKTWESNWGLSTLTTNDAGATAMTEFFTSSTLGGLTASFTSSPLSPIINQGVSFSATAVGGTAPYTYSWAFGDGSTGTGQTASHSFASANTFSVILAVKDSASPQNTATSTSTVIVVPLPPPPDFGLSANQGSLSIQQGSSGTATITVTSISGLTGAVALSTTVTPSGPTASLSSPSVTLTSGGTGTSTLTVSTTGTTPLGPYTVGVAGTTVALSHSVTISITVTNQPPPPPPGSAPTLVGWGGVRLDEAAAGTAGLGSTSNVFSGESISALEADVQKFQSLGYNTIRVSFQSQCNSPMPQLGPYSATNLDRAIRIAKYYSFWIIVDWHGYHDLEPTYLSCWLSTWKGIVQQFSGTYSQIVWEPENEPIGGSNSSGGSISLSELSSGYQQWINQARTLGDAHYVVVPNLCVYTCSGWPSAAATSWATVNDTIGHVFINMHTYMYYPYWSGQGWNNATADNAANMWYQAVVQGMKTTGWPALNTEGGADWISGSPPDVFVPGPGTVSATITTIHFVQRLTYLNDHNSPRIGWVLWPAGKWTNCCTGGGLYGALEPAGWGNQITLLSLSLRPDFGISASPTPLSIMQGASGTATITANSLNSLVGTISLSGGSLPSGATVSFSPLSIVLTPGGSGTSTLTISTSSTTSIGSYTLTITGTNGTVGRTATVSFSVTQPPVPDFGISSDQLALSIIQGTSGSATITLSSLVGFTGAVNLVSSLSTSSATASLSASTISLTSGGTGTSTLMVSTTTSTSQGTYSVQVTGSSGSLSHSVTISITVNLPPDFGLSASSTTLSIMQGALGTSTITANSLNNLVGTISLSGANAPSGAAASFNPSGIVLAAGGSGTSTLTISTSGSTPIGSYTLTVTGTYGSISRTVTVSFSVTVPPASDFAISSDQSSILIIQGSSASATITLSSLLGFTGSVNLVSSVSTSSATASLTSSSVSLASGGRATSTLAVSTTSSAPVGTYSVQVTGTSGGLSHSVTVTLVITVPAVQPLQGSFSTNATNLVMGQTVSFTATAVSGVQPYSFSWDFGDGSTGSGASASHIYALPGNYTVKLVVVDASSITIAVTEKLIVMGALLTVPSIQTTSLGKSLSFTITASVPGAQGSIFISASNLPPGASFTSTPGNPATGTFSWTPGQSLQPGTYSVTFKAVAAGSSYSTSKTVPISVAGAPAGPCSFCAVPAGLWSLVSLVAIGATVGLLITAGLITFSRSHRTRPWIPTPGPSTRRSMPSRVSVSPIYGNARKPFGTPSRRVPEIRKSAQRRVIEVQTGRRTAKVEAHLRNVRSRRTREQ